MSRVNINNLEKSVDQYSLLLTDSTNTATYKNPATKTYNPLTDDVIFFSEGGSVLVDGNVMGWSNPEGVQWSNVPVWDNRSWNVSLNVETDGLGYFSSAITTQAFTSFFALIQHLNQILATYGSSFRLAAGAGGDRILLTQINGTPIIDTADPYFVAGLFNNLELLIEDTITGGDYLVKATNPKEFTVSNIYILGGKDLFKGKISSGSGSNIPIPILSLGSNYILQHTRADDITTFMSNTFTSTNNQLLPSTTYTGTVLANDSIKIGISYNRGNYNEFLANKPMIFLELLTHRSRSNHKRNLNKPQWVHPISSGGSLNRTGSSYGNGDPSGFKTEWDLAVSTNQEQIIDLNQQGFYKNTSITLPQRWVDFVKDPGNQLRYQRSGYLTPTGFPNESCVNVFKQPIRFRFGYIDPLDGKSVILGEPSEKLYITIKQGLFEPSGDTFIYDWVVRH